LVKETKSEKIRVINIDDENISVKEFLTDLRFEDFASQYEMQLNLF